MTTIDPGRIIGYDAEGEALFERDALDARWEAAIDRLGDDERLDVDVALGQLMFAEDQEAVDLAIDTIRALVDRERLRQAVPGRLTREQAVEQWRVPALAAFLRDADLEVYRTVASAVQWPEDPRDLCAHDLHEAIFFDEEHRTLTPERFAERLDQFKVYRGVQG